MSSISKILRELVENDLVRHSCGDIEIERDAFYAAKLSAGALKALLAEIDALRDLVQTLLDNDPDTDAADGITVLDVWRKRASSVLTPRR